MFKKVFETISKTFSQKEAMKPGAAPLTPRAPSKARGLLDKVTSPAAAAPARPKAAPATDARQRPPEEICGITSKMNKEEIRERLALLYRRYNRATSSLDAKLRTEADHMLDAIVAVREKHFGPI